MAIIGAARSYHKKFRFVVEIDDLSYAGFQSCTELSSEFAEIAHYEGGRLTADKSPGRITFDDVTLARGVTENDELYRWHLQVGDAADDVGAVDNQFKKNVEIVQLDMAGSQIRRWRLVNAWPKRFTAGDWDNDSDENVIEQLVLSFDYFIRVR